MNIVQQQAAGALLLKVSCIEVFAMIYLDSICIVVMLNYLSDLIMFSVVGL